MMRTILLAAGLSTRMGAQKLLLPFGGSTVVDTVIAALREADMTPVICVASHEVARGMASRASDDLIVVINDLPERGQASSLRLGLAEVPQGEPFAVMLGDLPLVRASGIKELRERYESLAEGSTALIPRRGHAFGHPMMFAPIWRDRLIDTSGDRGGRAVIAAHSHEAAFVDADDGSFTDIDTRDDYDRVKKNFGCRHSLPRGSGGRAAPQAPTP